MLHKVEYNRTAVECYGDLQDDSNISIVCDDEWDDCVWTDGNPVTGLPFKTWEEAVTILSKRAKSQILEMSAI